MKTFISLFLITSVLFSQYDETGKRGAYFSKKEYSGTALPSFKENRSKLPSPILEGNPGYVELYWKAWSIAFDHFKRPPEGSPFVSNYVDEAFSPSIFQWDTIFMIMFARYGHAIFPAIASLDNFYSRQYENGYICREIQEADGADYIFVGREHTVNPPLIAWAEVESYKVTGDTSRFRMILPPLMKYAEWLEIHRKMNGTAHQLYWNTGLGSGMDNLPLKGSGWVDMSSQMVLFYSSLSFIAGECGDRSAASSFQQTAQGIAERINKFMWNENDGFYYNIEDNGTQQRLFSIAGFWPMLAGVASEDQARRLAAHLMDPGKFWRSIPFPALAANEKEYHSNGNYWLGGVWAPTNVMVIKGLERYGMLGGSSTDYTFNELATAATEKYLDGIYDVYTKTGTLWENYSPDLLMRGSPSQKDFVGWTGCGPIQLLIENVLGMHPDGAHASLHWRISRTDRHGIEQLRFGDVVATLICQKRENIRSTADIHVIANAPFTLTVSIDGKEPKRFEVRKGTQQFSY